MANLPKCVDPAQIYAGALLAYLEGDAPASIREHLARCPACREEAAALRDTQRELTALSLRAACPPVEALLGYQAGLLSAAEAQGLAAHLATCVDCRAEIAELATVNPALPALSLWDRLAFMGHELLSAIRMPDHMAQPALAVRGNDASAPVRYQASPFEVILIKAPLTGGTYWHLQGTVSGNAALIPQPALASLLRADHVQAEDYIDQTGYFSFDQILHGTYQLHIALPTVSIIIDNVTIP